MDDLPVLNGQPRKACPKGKTRLELKTDEKKVTVVDDRAFKKAVRDRDHLHCRKCLRKVRVVLELVDDRAEVHHIHGRRGDFRFDPIFALLLCAKCHEQVTGKVNEKYVIVGTVFIDVRGKQCTDARQRVIFERVA
jgi:hypothetical protein